MLTQQDIEIIKSILLDDSKNDTEIEYGILPTENDEIILLQSGKNKRITLHDLFSIDIVGNITAALNKKVDKVVGKELSSNDYTSAEKAKLAGIQANAQVNVQSDYNESNTSSNAYIRNKPDLSKYETIDSVTLKLFAKVDKVAGKTLTSNDFTTEYKDKIDTLNQYEKTAVVDVKLDKKVDKIPGKALSTNDFTNLYKDKLDRLGEYATNASVDTKLEKKVDKELGKGLSDENFSIFEKTKLSQVIVITLTDLVTLP